MRLSENENEKYRVRPRFGSRKLQIERGKIEIGSREQEAGVGRSPSGITYARMTIVANSSCKCTKSETLE